METEKSDRIVKQQKLMVMMAVMCFMMLSVVIVLGWYVFDYSSNKIKKNNEAVTVLLENIKLENKNKISDATQEDLSGVSDVDFSQKDLVDYSKLTAEEVIKLVSRHILLTEGEVTVASITNIEGLRADYPELFVYAKNGDKLIFYSLGIIIYDPVLDKVVDVARRFSADTIIPKSVDETK